MPAPYRAAIVTVSDSIAQGTRQDVSGPAVARLLEADSWTIGSSEVLPDDFTLIRERLEALARNGEIDAIFTTGGTGVGPRDRTPEATTAVMERSLPGLAELMRREGLKKTPRAALSRAVAGMKAKTVLIKPAGQPGRRGRFPQSHFADPLACRGRGSGRSGPRAGGRCRYGRSSAGVRPGGILSDLFRAGRCFAGHRRYVRAGGEV